MTLAIAAWAATQFALAGIWWAVLPSVLARLHVPDCADPAQPAFWGTAAALLHGLLGLRLMDPRVPTNRKRAGIDPRIVGGLKVLALHYFTCAGLVLVGLLRFRSCATVFVAAWSGLFLILIVSELIVFSRGVKRL
jgi:hypothetical protein